MQTSLDCVPCLLRQSLKAARAVTTNVGVQKHVIWKVLRMLAELTGADDPYQRAKTRFNRLVMDALPELRERVRHAEDPLLAAAQFAVAANAIDMGISSAITEEAVREALRGTLGEPVHGEWREFVDAAAEAKNILYLTDNAGEIAVDRLVIEVLGPERVTVAVRGHRCSTMRRWLVPEKLGWSSSRRPSTTAPTRLGCCSMTAAANFVSTLTTRT